MFTFTGDYTIVWRKGTQVLAAGSHMLIKDDRFRIQNNELELTKIFPQDAGDFVCQISLSAGDTLEIAHTVEVLGMYNSDVSGYPKLLCFVFWKFQNVPKIGFSCV